MQVCMMDRAVSFHSNQASSLMKFRSGILRNWSAWYLMVVWAGCNDDSARGVTGWAGSCCCTGGSYGFSFTKFKNCVVRACVFIRFQRKEQDSSVEAKALSEAGSSEFSCQLKKEVVDTNRVSLCSALAAATLLWNSGLPCSCYIQSWSCVLLQRVCMQLTLLQTTDFIWKKMFLSDSECQPDAITTTKIAVHISSA